MYISIKLPPEFGSFNQLRKENYPFNNLFTTYLAAVSKLGLDRKMDVAELVGYIEDRVFDGQRLPDVPKGTEPVNIRYKINIPEDADDNHPGNIVQRYIEGSVLTNRMAVMYIARMTLRMSAAYGTSLFRLTKLITDLNDGKMEKKVKTETKKQSVQEKQEPIRQETKLVKQEPEVADKEDILEETPMPMPKVSAKASESKPVQETAPKSSASIEAERARAAVGALADLAAQVAEPESESVEEPAIVETNPALQSFL